MIVLQTIAVAFAMFSAIPVPQFDWNEKNMRYAMCAFPLIGVVIGAAWCVCGALPLPGLAKAAGFALIPVWITGGIHLDGYADTCDALSSYGDREKKLEILKDPHCGAFAVIRLCSYFLAYFALCTCVSFTPRVGVLWVLALVLERALSGLAVASFPMAKNTGLAHTFATAADKTVVRRVLAVLAAVLYFAVFPHRLDLSGSWLAAAYGGEMDAQTLRRELGVSNLSYMLETGLFAVTLAPVINMFAALGEEAGWRGYMMPHLKEQLGLLNGRLLGGVIWGVWHWPLMLLVGYEYGTNYLGAPVLGLFVWCIVCFALNTLLDWLYEKTGCIWVPSIAHGAFNAVAALFVVLTNPADSYYNVLGPAPIGLIGMLPMLAAAVWLTLRKA